MFNRVPEHGAEDGRFSEDDDWSTKHISEHEDVYLFQEFQRLLRFVVFWSLFRQLSRIDDDIPFTEPLLNLHQSC